LWDKGKKASKARALEASSKAILDHLPWPIYFLAEDWRPFGRQFRFYSLGD